MAAIKVMMSVVQLSFFALIFASFGSAFLISDPDNLIMYFSEVTVAITSKEAKSTPEIVYFNKNTTTVNYTVTTAADSIQVAMEFLPSTTASKSISTFNLNMNITSGRGYWKLEGITTDLTAGTNIKQTGMKLLPEIPMEAPLKRSFHCSRFGRLSPAFTAQLGNFTPTVEIRGLQAQAFNLTGMKFSEPWECVGFFSAGIWSGIFIVAILIGILTWGLAMIMDVKTMDRFDDPKGKNISFGSGNE